MGWSSFKWRLAAPPPPAEPIPWDDSFEENLGLPADRSKFEDQMKHDGAEHCGEEPNCVLFHSSVEAGAAWSMSYDDGSEASTPCHPECREAGARQRGVTWEGMVDDETFWARVSELVEPLHEQYEVETEKERAKLERRLQKETAKSEKRLKKWMSPRAEAYETVDLGPDYHHGGRFTIQVPVERPSGEEIVQFLLDREPERNRFGSKRIARAVAKLAESHGRALSEWDAQEIAFLLTFEVRNGRIEVPVEAGWDRGPILIRAPERPSQD